LEPNLQWTSARGVHCFFAIVSSLLARSLKPAPGSVPAARGFNPNIFRANDFFS